MEPTQTKPKGNALVVIVGILVLIIIVVLVRSNNRKKALEESLIPSPSDTTTEETPVTTTKPVKTPVVDPTREGTSVGSGAGTYATLMLTYKGKMVQFNKECAVITNKQGFKQGTDILLDNRDNTPVKIVIGSRTFNLPGYGYKVIDLPTVGSFQVDCNSRFNVVTITVQK